MTPVQDEIYRRIPGHGRYMLMFHRIDIDRDRIVARYETPEQAKAVASHLNRLMAKSDPVRGSKFEFYFVHNLNSYPILPWLKDTLKMLEIRHKDNQEYNEPEEVECEY